MFDVEVVLLFFVGSCTGRLGWMRGGVRIGLRLGLMGEGIPGRRERVYKNWGWSLGLYEGSHIGM